MVFAISIFFDVNYKHTQIYTTVRLTDRPTRPPTCMQAFKLTFFWKKKITRLCVSETYSIANCDWINKIKYVEIINPKRKYIKASFGFLFVRRWTQLPFLFSSILIALSMKNGQFWKWIHSNIASILLRITCKCHGSKHICVCQMLLLLKCKDDTLMNFICMVWRHSKITWQLWTIIIIFQFNDI